MKNLNRIFAFLLSGIFLASCMSTSHIEKDATADFSNYKTFAWVDKDDEGTQDGRKTNDLVEQKIKEAVQKELEKSAGWKVTKNKPDVLLSYDVLVEKGVVEDRNAVYSRPFTRVVFNPYTRRYSNIYYPSQFVGYERDQRTIKEGTITISMIDAKADKMIWQGWTTEEVNNKNLTSKEIEASVRSIFRKFDVAKN